MTDHTLEVYEGPTDGQSILNLLTDRVFAGDCGSGDNWYCPGCYTIFAQSLYPGQFLDLLFRCNSCGSLGASPRRQPGQPIAGRPVILAAGQFYLKSVVDLTGKPVPLAGTSARDGYLRETSAQPIPFAGTEDGSPTLTANFLKELSSRAKSLLGDRYAQLRSSDIRGQTSPTPPAARHRLVELISCAEEVARVLEETKPGAVVQIRVDEIAELYATIGVFERWRNHPAWPHLVASLASETEGPHSLMLLTAASYLSDTGNGVGLITKGVHGRIPDLWIEPSLIERVDLEVKTPLALRGARATAISADLAEEVIARQVNKAASKRRGQLASTRPGLVAIGAFQLPIGKLEMLASATQRVLERQKDRKHHLAGVLLCAFGYTITKSNKNSGNQEFGSIMESRLIPHPGYRGDLATDEGLPRWRTDFP